ncbi:response regulator [Thiorhodococcus mannitoliphagus]|uniref:Response regulator n=1 Tax=Thiorhodococcus mannitoliphagus TaxID=329406 RepID=A0A6P1DP28_9GAMM|nr:response regulator [Thiorhodococcus mannitoliphagus]NEX19300.1 response regulator [Thiorhodococcus mannitoliphagus]
MGAAESREFAIALCGFPDTDQKALNRAFMLSKVRPRRYCFWEDGRRRPDFFAVNEDLPAGLEAWADLRAQFSEHVIPVVRIGAADKLEGDFKGVVNVFFKRPVLANRILKTLDALVIEVYQFAPELAIHDDMAMPLRSEEAPAVEVAAQAPLSAKRILVVDDSESVRKMMEMRLVKKGYAVDFAVTGEEALTKAREQSYDLIFLDVMLPGISGYDVSRHLKKDIQVRAPVVMLTGKTSRIDKLRGTLASADAYLTKPLTLDNLNDTLQRYL